MFIYKKRDFSMFYQTFLSPQVQRCAIITYKHGIHKLPQELPRPKDLGCQEIRKYLKTAQTT